jgi:putative thioredoxin
VTASPYLFDVEETDFADRVLDRSAEVPSSSTSGPSGAGPAARSGPCSSRPSPRREGAVELAKVDVDRNQGVAQRYRVQGIPTVLGIRDGQVAAQFTGVRPAAELETFLDDLVPTEADEAVARARSLPPEQARESCAKRSSSTPTTGRPRSGSPTSGGHRRPRAGARAHPAPPSRPRRRGRGHPRTAGQRLGGDIARLRAAVEEGRADGDTHLDLGRALAADGAYPEAIDRLLDAVELGGDVREPAREQLVALFNVLGEDDEHVRSARPRLARALF